MYTKSLQQLQTKARQSISSQKL